MEWRQEQAEVEQLRIVRRAFLVGSPDCRHRATPTLCIHQGRPAVLMRKLLPKSLETLVE